MAVALVLAVIALGGAQEPVDRSVAGVFLGDTAQEASRRWGLPIQSIPDEPRRSVVADPARHGATFCDGVAVTLGEVVGDDLDTFAELVSDAEMYSDGVYSTTYRVGDRPGSAVTVTFEIDATTRLQLRILSDGGRVSVTRTWETDNSCDPAA